LTFEKESTDALGYTKAGGHFGRWNQTSFSLDFTAADIVDG
jgi:hypothetical protein